MNTFNSNPTAPDDVIPIRRAFKKSRRGCRTCKNRKVKCDEVRPVCGNCSRRFLGLKSCDFDLFIDSAPTRVERKSETRRQGPRPGNPSHGSLRPAMGCYPDHMGASEQSRVLELRLMHHYTSFTCGELPDGNTLQGRQTWGIDIPRLAFSSDLVLTALLGISALHLCALTPNNESIAYAARLYFDRAVKKHRMALSNADCSTAESLLATAILITHHSWLASHTPTGDQPYELPLQTYYMARGIQSLIDHMWPLLKESGYLWYVERQPIADRNDQARTTHSSGGVQDELVLLPEVFEGNKVSISGHPFLSSVLEDLATLSKTFAEDEVSASDKQIYQKTVLELSSLCKFIVTAAPANWFQRRVATMPLRLPERFLELVEQRDPRALVLLARNFALLKLIDGVWWLHGFGQSQQVAEYSIDGIRGLVPAEWIWAMDWPSRIVAGNITLEHCGRQRCAN